MNQYLSDFLLGHEKLIELAFTLALVFVGIATVIVNYLNVRELRNQASELRNQVGELKHQSLLLNKFFLSNLLVELNLSKYNFERDGMDTAEEKKTTIDYIKRSLENEINRTRQKLSEIERSLK